MERRSGEQRREEILEAATRILLRDGIASLTTATLAEAVGVTTGALFRHFASRELMLLALAERVATQLRADLAADDGDAVTQLRAFVKARSGTVHRMPAAPAMMLSPDVHLALPADGRAVLAAVMRETFVHVSKLIERGQREGSFRADLPPPQATIAVLGMLALRTLSRALPTPVASLDLADAAIALLSPPNAHSETRS